VPPGRIIIADDRELARLGLRTILEPEPDLEVIGEAATGREAVALSSQLQPDLVLMDIRMPDLDELMATRAIKEELPRTSILIVTLPKTRTICGRRVLKDASRREVVAAVRQVLSGESPLDPKLAAQLIRRLAGQTQPKEQPASHGDNLTQRELEVLRLAAEGKTNHDIAQSLFVSVGTVEVHVELGYWTPPSRART